MKKTKLLLLAIGFLLLNTLVVAQKKEKKKKEEKQDEGQSQSVIVIEQARALYSLGRMDSIPKVILRASSRGSITKSELPEAYKLLTISYIFLDEQEEADKNMLALLKEDKLFKPNETDPAELHNLYDQYRTWPIFRVGVMYGGNMSFTQVLAGNPTYDFNNPDEIGKYGTNFGAVNVGLMLEKDFLKRLITVETDFLYGTLKTTYNQSSGNYTNVLGQPTSAIARIDEVETQSFFGINAAVQIHPLNRYYEKAKLMLYGIVGTSYNRLLTSKINNTTSTTIEGGTSPTIEDDLLIDDAQSNNIQIRSKNNSYIFGGLGFKWNLGMSHFFMNATYNYGLNNLTIQQNNPSELAKNYRDIKIHYAQLNIGWAFSIYKPKKLIF